MASDNTAVARRVLIVDDYTPFRRAAAKFLSKNRCEVQEAGDGPTALKLALSRAFDVILLDLKLGSPMSGVAVLETLRASPETEGVPVIAMSGVAIPAEVSATLSAGASDFVAKGQNGDMLRSIERVLSPIPTPLADVLHLEDDDEWALLVDLWLGEQGLKVHRVRSHAELRAYLSGGRPLPRCLVTDLRIGADDGMAACDEIKTSPAFQGLPIVILTAKPVSQVDCLEHLALYRVDKESASAKAELRAIVTSVLAQQDRSRGVIDAGDVRIDCRTGVVLHRGRAIQLQGGFLSALIALILASRQAVDDRNLYDAFLSRGSYHDDEDPVSIAGVVRNYVYKLRLKLGEPLARRIVFVKDAGYAYRP